MLTPMLITPTLVVRLGATKSDAMLRPAMAPITVRGNDTRAKRAPMMITVCQGRAAVEPRDHATVLTHMKIAVRGAGNTSALRTVFHT
jgi:hypothetical protein